MPRRFDRKTGWNRQFKWKPLRRDRWDPFPKDHLPFIDDFSVGSFLAKKAQVDSMSNKRKYDDFATPTTLLGKRRPELSVRKAPPAKRQQTRSGAKRVLFTNDNVAMMGTAGAGLAGMAYAGIGRAVDDRVRAAVEEGFRVHAAFNESGIPTFDALTESAMVGRYLDRAIAAGERILPLVEDLLVPLMF